MLTDICDVSNCVTADDIKFTLEAISVIQKPQSDYPDKYRIYYIGS